MAFFVETARQKYVSVQNKIRKEIEFEEYQVVNMRDKQLQEPGERNIKGLIAKFPKIYISIRSVGHFSTYGSAIQVELEF